MLALVTSEQLPWGHWVSASLYFELCAHGSLVHAVMVDA